MYVRPRAVPCACANPTSTSASRVAVETGMRRSELASLTWEEIDLNKQTAHLPTAKTNVPRTIPLSKAAIKSLRAFGIEKEGRLFALVAESMSQAFESACESHRGNIKGVRFQDLRHEATSRLFEKGLNVMEVAAITGHKTLDMLKRYTHLRAEDLAKNLIEFLISSSIWLVSLQLPLSERQRISLPPAHFYPLEDGTEKWQCDGFL
nr:site-specific integrase [Janthinobacterium lividum]